MIFKWLTSLIGDSDEKKLRALKPLIAKINAFEAAMQALSNDDLRAKTAEFKTRLAKGQTLDDLLPEAFALVREASVRTIGLVPS